MSATALKKALSGESSSIPMYQRIKNAIVGKIQSGEWQPGKMIPSENQLAQTLGVSRMTINRPLRELANAGVLNRVHGLGTFVAETPRQASLIELKSLALEIEAQGKVHSAKVLSSKHSRASTEIAQHMNLEKGSKVFQIMLVHFQDDVPIQIENRYVNPAAVPDFMQVDFTKTTPTEFLISQIAPDELEHIVEAVMPDEFASKVLSIPFSEPCLKLKRRTWKRGLVVTSVEMLYPSSRYQLGSRYSPSGAPIKAARAK